MKSITSALSAISHKLDTIRAAEAAEPALPEDDDSKDRKRMKERLKETLEMDKKRFRQAPVPEGWLEYLFGICEADGRVGKVRSRYASRQV